MWSSPATSVIEHAGPPVVVAGLLKAIFRAFLADRSSDARTDTKLRRVWTVVCPPAGDGLADLLAGLGFPATTGYLEMLHVPDPARLAARCGVDAAGMRSVAKAMVPKLFFGPERCTALPVPSLPMEFFLRSSDRV